MENMLQNSIQMLPFLQNWELTLEVPIAQNGQTYFADELLMCVWSFCGVGA